MRFLRLIFIFFYFIDGFGGQTPFLVTSIPKSGSNLFVKLIYLMTDCRAVGSWNGKMPAEEIDHLLLNLDNTGLFSFSHANEPHYLDFAKRHPEYVKLFQIRDLRDVMVSAVFHFNKELEKRGLRTFDQKLTFMLTSNIGHPSWIENNAKLYSEWVALPNTHVIRFEDLVGEAGKGSAEKQKEVISLVFSALNRELTQAKLDWIVDNLFGRPSDEISWTFRKGHIGDWKIYFQEHHKLLFNKRWGKYQEMLGYSLCEVGKE